MGPSGSWTRDGYRVETSNPDMFFSEDGQIKLSCALRDYRDAGASLGVTPTHRLTDFRVGQAPIDSISPKAELELHENTRRYTEAAVRLLREVFGQRMMGSIAPLTDTSGGHDYMRKDLLRLGREFTAQRHAPQMKALKKAGVNAILGEAFRYLEDAEGVVQVADQIGMEVVAVCFEANGHGMPDPANQGMKFEDVKRHLTGFIRQGSGLKILVGANCTGVTNLNRIIDSGDLLDLSYPNAQNLGPDVKEEVGCLADNAKRTPREDDRYHALLAKYLTGIDEFRSFWEKALKAGIPIIGGCCGTTPAHTRIARRVVEEFMARRS
jgi:S-methylmethionine-dependent homocysteine/selenocysteine methylase